MGGLSRIVGYAVECKMVEELVAQIVGRLLHLCGAEVELVTQTVERLLV